MRHVRSTIVTVILLLQIPVSALYAAEARLPWQSDWDKTVEAAKKRRQSRRRDSGQRGTAQSVGRDI